MAAFDGLWISISEEDGWVHTRIRGPHGTARHAYKMELADPNPLSDHWDLFTLKGLSRGRTYHYAEALRWVTLGAKTRHYIKKKKSEA